MSAWNARSCCESGTGMGRQHRGRRRQEGKADFFYSTAPPRRVLASARAGGPWQCPSASAHLSGDQGQVTRPDHWTRKMQGDGARELHDAAGNSRPLCPSLHAVAREGTASRGPPCRPTRGAGRDLKNENYLILRACVHLRVFTRTVELGRSAGIVKFNVVRFKKHGY